MKLLYASVFFFLFVIVIVTSNAITLQTNSKFEQIGSKSNKCDQESAVSQNFSINHLASLILSQNAPSQDVYFDAEILGEEDEITISDREKICPKNNSSPIISFICCYLNDKCVKKTLSITNFFFFYPSSFIYLRVLRI